LTYSCDEPDKISSLFLFAHHAFFRQPPLDISPDVNYAAQSYQQKVDGGDGVDTVEIHERVPGMGMGVGMGEGGMVVAPSDGNGHAGLMPPPPDTTRFSTCSNRPSVNLYTYNSDAIREVQLSADELLFLVASLSDGLSGRALRKLPLKAHAFYLQKPVSDCESFLWAIQTVLEEAVVAKRGY
jgi:hypothetical protein